MHIDPIADPSDRFGRVRGMSDLDVLQAIEEIERCLRTDRRSLNPVSLQEWQCRFQEAVASAERGTSWTRIVQKAQTVQGLLEQTLIQMVVNRQVSESGFKGQFSRRRSPRFQRPGRS